MPSAYKKGEIRIPKKFTSATNPRFSGVVPKAMSKADPLTILKERIIELIKKNTNIDEAQKKAEIRAVYSAETPDQLESYLPGFIDKTLGKLTSDIKENQKTYALGAIHRDLFDADNKLKPGKSFSHLPSEHWNLPAEELIKYLPRQQRPEVKVQRANEYKNIEADLRSTPKFKNEKAFQEWLKPRIAKIEKQSTADEIRRAHEQAILTEELNPDRAAQEAAQENINNIVKEDKPLRSYVPELPAFNHLAHLETSHGTPAEQQFQHAILNKTLDEMSKPYKPYTGERFADRSKFEKEAQDLIIENSPFSNPDVLAHHRGTKKRIEDLSHLPKQSHVAAPYLKKSAGNPLDVFKSQLDKDVLEKISMINEDMDKKFKEEHIPRIERANKIGPAKYGAVGKALERATSEHQKNKNRLAKEALLENTRLALGAGQNYLGHQANLGEIASKNATQERGDEERATHFLSQQHQNEQNQKEKHIQHLKSEGEINRAREQQIRDEQFNEFNRAKEHGYETLVKGTNIRSKMPQVGTEYRTRAQTQPPVARPNINQQLGSGFINMGANQFPRGFKKGGPVRLKRAPGGMIGEAVDNAVIEHSNPLYELKRLINRNNAMDISQTKIGKRRKYNAGGAVNPIQAGAEQAAAFKEKDNLKNFLSQRQQTSAEHPMSQMLNDFMIGVSHVGGDNTLGRAANAYKESAGQREAVRDKADKRQLESLMAQYDVEKESRKEQQMLKKVERDEKYRDDLLNFKKGLLESKGSQKKAPKIDEVDKDILKTTSKSLLNAPSLLQDLDKLESISKNIDTGGVTNNIPGLRSPLVQGMISKGEQSDYDDFDTITEELALKASMVFGSKAGARIVDMFRKTKPHRGMSSKAIKNTIDRMRAKVEGEINKASFVNESYEKGVLPKNALVEYYKLNPSATKEDEEIETPTETVEETAEPIADAYANDPILQELEAQYNAAG